MTTHLSYVNVRARVINVRVVRVKQSGVDGMSRSNFFASIAFLDDVSRLAIFANCAKADCTADGEVATRRVDGARVDYGELVGRHVVGGGDAIANVALGDGVRACAVRREGRCWVRMKISSVHHAKISRKIKDVRLARSGRTAMAMN